ncbi:hypothetical protein DICA4_C00826 [Diutina catenulata]
MKDSSRVSLGSTDLLCKQSISFLHELEKQHHQDSYEMHGSPRPLASAHVGGADIVYNCHDEAMFDDDRVFPSLQAATGNDDIVKFDDSDPTLINHATLKALVVQLTSPDVVDYNFICDFFLTYRLFVTPDRVMSMLLSRLVWALHYLRSIDDDKICIGQRVLVRTFVVLRHWIVNYFVDDFVPAPSLGDLFCDTINQVTQSALVTSTDVFETKVICDLKGHWLHVVNQWTSASVDVDFLHDTGAMLDYQLTKLSEVSAFKSKRMSIHSNPAYRRSAMLSMYDTSRVVSDPVASEPQFSINNLLLHHQSSRLSLQHKLSTFKKSAHPQRAPAHPKAPHNHMNLVDSSHPVGGASHPAGSTKPKETLLPPVSVSPSMNSVSSATQSPIMAALQGGLPEPQGLATARFSSVGSRLASPQISAPPSALKDSPASSSSGSPPSAPRSPSVRQALGAAITLPESKKSPSPESVLDYTTPGFSTSGSVPLPSSKVLMVCPPTPTKKMDVVLDLDALPEASLLPPPKLDSVGNFSVFSGGSGSDIGRRSSIKKLVEGWKRTVAYARSPSTPRLHNSGSEQTIVSSVQTITRSESTPVVGGRVDVLSARIVDELEYLIRCYVADGSTRVSRQLLTRRSSNLDSGPTTARTPPLTAFFEPSSTAILEHEDETNGQQSFQRPVSINWNDDLQLEDTTDGPIRVPASRNSVLDFDSVDPVNESFESVSTPSNLTQYDADVAELGISPAKRHSISRRDKKRCSNASFRRDSMKSYLSYDSAFSVSRERVEFDEVGQGLRKKHGYHDLRQLAGVPENPAPLRTAPSLRFSNLCGLTELPFDKKVDTCDSSIFSVALPSTSASTRADLRSVAGSVGNSTASVAIPGISNHVLKELAAIPDESFQHDPVEFTLGKLEGRDSQKQLRDPRKLPSVATLYCDAEDHEDELDICISSEDVARTGRVSTAAHDVSVDEGSKGSVRSLDPRAETTLDPRAQSSESVAATPVEEMRSLDPRSGATSARQSMTVSQLAMSHSSVAVPLATSSMGPSMVSVASARVVSGGPSSVASAGLHGSVASAGLHGSVASAGLHGSVASGPQSSVASEPAEFRGSPELRAASVRASVARSALSSHQDSVQVVVNRDTTEARLSVEPVHLTTPPLRPISGMSTSTAQPRVSLERIPSVDASGLSQDTPDVLDNADNTEAILAAINNANTADVSEASQVDISQEQPLSPTSPRKLNASTPRHSPPELPSPDVKSPKVLLDRYQPSNYSIADVVRHGLHVSFILQYPSEELAHHFTYIERDMLQDIDWKDLIEHKWSQELTPVNSWLEIIANDTYYDTNKGVNLVIARFNLMVNWIISEIVATRDQQERLQILSRLIHVAQACCTMQNYSTLMQIILAVTSEKIQRLKDTWKSLPPGDILTLKNLEELASPLKNFLNIRISINHMTPSKGCIPFVGLYLSDLIFNAERPTFIKAKHEGDDEKLVNFSKFRTSVHIVKSLSQCIEWSHHYQLTVDPQLLSKCLYIKSLDEEEMNYCIRHIYDP